jgi:hypothetical protein
VLFVVEMEEESNRRGSRASNADAVLAGMGYKSELPRSLSMMSILGLHVVIQIVSCVTLLIMNRSFAIMAVPFGRYF